MRPTTAASASSRGDRGLWLPGPVESGRFLGLELAPGALSGARGFVSATGELEPKPDLAALVAAVAQEGRLQFRAA